MVQTADLLVKNHLVPVIAVSNVLIKMNRNYHKIPIMSGALSYIPFRAMVLDICVANFFMFFSHD